MVELEDTMCLLKNVINFLQSKTFIIRLSNLTDSSIRKKFFLSNFLALFFIRKILFKIFNSELIFQNEGRNLKIILFWLFWKILYFHGWKIIHESNHIVQAIVNRSNDNSEAWFLGLCVSSISLLLVAIIKNKHNALRMNVFLDEDKAFCFSESFILSSFFSQSKENVFIINQNWFLFTFLSVINKRTAFQYQDVCISDSIDSHIQKLSFEAFQKRILIHIYFTSQELWIVCFHCENLWTYIWQFQIFSIKFLVVFQSSVHHAIWFLLILKIVWLLCALVDNLLRSLAHVSLALVWTSESVLDWISSSFISYCRTWKNIWLHKSHCIQHICSVLFICNFCAFCNIQDIEWFHIVQFLQAWIVAW